MPKAKKDNSSNTQKIVQPILVGEFANWVGVMNNQMQTIIDFGFVQPAPQGQPKSGVINRRLILPPVVAKELSKILNKEFSK